jgi:two-component system sensor histidine kinase AtoS
LEGDVSGPTTSSNESPPLDAEWLVNQIAHTLRNPIFAAMVQAEALMVRAEKSEGTTRAMQLVHRQLKRLEADLEEMLLYGRPATVNCRRFDLVRLVEQLADIYQIGETEAPAAVELVTCGSLDVDLDPDAVRIILDRLVSNSIQHSGPPHPIRIEVSAPDDRTACLTVIDEGEGIAEDIKEKMFLPFYPQHSGRPGLGLAVASKFAHLLGGRIEIDSVPGRGTVARCTLPISSSA